MSDLCDLSEQSTGKGNPVNWLIKKCKKNISNSSMRPELLWYQNKTNIIKKNKATDQYLSWTSMGKIFNKILANNPETYVK